MKKIETVLFRPSVANGFILAVCNSITPFSYTERTIFTCLITVGTIFILRKKIMHTYNENIMTQPLWIIEFYSGKSIRKILISSYFLLLFVFVADWVIIPKLYISNFLEYFIYYTILQFCRLFVLLYIILHFCYFKCLKKV